MKKIVLVIAFVVVTVSATFAQNFAYVNSEYILKHIPEYASAQKQLDDLSQKWQQDVDQQYAEIEKLYKAYQNDQVLLNEDMRRRREDEIVKKEKDVKDYQKQKFGFEGELFKQREKLVQPIQQRVSKAIQDLAKAQSLDIILDRGQEVTFLYANPKLDKSNDVIIKLGLKPNPALAN
ncbi:MULTISPECIES: OmpH family outer membrane protein [Sphingobacterium]|jgi:outer membrane protein|uniref:OmpH family outer membrane protein n=1 Tax=Sphingobacterium TaxID=28453 RepID=UPI0004E5FB8C|nr:MULTISPECIES: OmpH family outer membrane protein [Sphingobacterium]CDS91706.1 Cationic outer membrane protein [Sphingobacterium sp. PM2-P1-29]SJN48876.1 Outer membrane protein H precursor [Sphingobacterium faecium PCAi_F2.5]HCU43629.1 OmpH family outer membrane protein [Sphingobacterium sp.]UPZ36666.1 OmpH family outer membrane protein [Sphingobacterium sp. PCS056]UXD68183.1 OmpH family outer membrane protein [Sphingobacterium faecium]